MSFSGDSGQRDLEIELTPYILPQTHVPAGIYGKLAHYLELLLKWNLRTNLTAIRDPGEIVRRHFGESLFAAQHLGGCGTLLDFGSGAGFPGIPIQLLRPDIQVTLAESQNKKAAFLREVVRTLDLESSIWANRVESMHEGTVFDVATLRAVDSMGSAVQTAAPRAGKRMVLLTTFGSLPQKVDGFTLEESIPVPGARDQRLFSLLRSKSA